MTDSARASYIDPTTIAFYNAPYLPDDEYEHRPALQLSSQENTNEDGPIAIYGNAGTGKTYAAVHLAHDFCARAKENKKDTFVLWFNARSIHSILASFHTIALQLGLSVMNEPRGDVCELVAEWLEQKVAQCSRVSSKNSSALNPAVVTVGMDRSYLIVVDGIESLEIMNQPLLLPSEFSKYSKPVYKHKAFRTYLPPEIVDGANWLFTTRSDVLANSFNARCIELESLSPGEAQSVCKRILGDKVPPDAGQMLADRLCTNPTVVSLAAGYIKHTGMTFADYADQISHLLKNPIRQSPPTGAAVDPYKGSDGEIMLTILEAAIYLTMHLLIDDNKRRETEDAITPFSLWSLVQCFGGLHVPLCWKMNKLFDGCTTEEEHPELTTLRDLSFIRRSHPGIFTASDVVLQGCCLCFPSPHETALEDAQETMLHFFRAWGLEGLEEKHLYLPLTEIVLNYPLPVSKERAELLERRAAHYLWLNFYKEAWRDTFAAYEMYQELCAEKENSKPALTALHRLGQIAFDMGQYELAQKMHQSALNGMRELVDEDEMFVECMTDLAMTLYRLGQHEASTSLVRKAMEERKLKYGEDATFFFCQSYLGSQLRSQGQVDEGLEMLVHAYNGLKRKRGESHIDTIGALSGICECLAIQGRWAEALEKRQREVKLREEVAGSESIGTLVAVSHLANIHYEIGNKAESHQLFKRSIEALIAKLGSNHPVTQQVRDFYKRLFRDRLVTV